MKTVFEIKSGRMVISDPSYELNELKNTTIENVKNGKWDSVVIHSDDNKHIESLIIINYKAFSEDESLFNEMNNLFEDENQLPRLFSVDSGQFGFFDFDSYRNNIKCKKIKRHSKVIIEPEDAFYSICCDRTASEQGWGLLPFGVVSTSGHGDGLYEVFALKNKQGEYCVFGVDFRNAFSEMINLIKTKSNE